MPGGWHEQQASDRALAPVIDNPIRSRQYHARLANFHDAPRIYLLSELEWSELPDNLAGGDPHGEPVGLQSRWVDDLAEFLERGHIDFITGVIERRVQPVLPTLADENLIGARYKHIHGEVFTARQVPDDPQQAVFSPGRNEAQCIIREASENFIREGPSFNHPQLAGMYLGVLG